MRIAESWLVLPHGARGVEGKIVIIFEHEFIAINTSLTLFFKQIRC